MRVCPLGSQQPDESYTTGTNNVSHSFVFSLEDIQSKAATLKECVFVCVQVTSADDVISADITLPSDSGQALAHEYTEYACVRY